MKEFIIMYRRTEVYMSGVNISSLQYLKIQCCVLHSFLLPLSFNNLTSCCLETLVFSICRLFVAKWIPSILFGITYKQPLIRYSQCFIYIYSRTIVFPTSSPLSAPFSPLSLLELLSVFCCLWMNMASCLWYSCLADCVHTASQTLIYMMTAWCLLLRCSLWLRLDMLKGVGFVVIMSKFILTMTQVSDLIMNKPNCCQTYHILVPLPAVSLNFIKLSDFSVPYLIQVYLIWIFLNHYQVELLINVFYRWVICWEQ